MVGVVQHLILPKTQMADVANEDETIWEFGG